MAICSMINKNLPYPIKDAPTQGSKKNNKKKGKYNSDNETIISPAEDTAQIIEDAAKKEILIQVEALNWDELFFTVGYLQYVSDFANSLSQAAVFLASEWNEYAVDATFQFDKSVPTDISNWSSQQIAIFLLQQLLDNYPIPLPVIEKLDAIYHFTDRGRNAEIKLRWQTLALKSGAPWIVPHVIDAAREEQQQAEKVAEVAIITSAAENKTVEEDTTTTSASPTKNEYVVVESTEVDDEPASTTATTIIADAVTVESTTEAVVHKTLNEDITADYFLGRN